MNYSRQQNQTGTIPGFEKFTSMGSEKVDCTPKSRQVVKQLSDKIYKGRTYENKTEVHEGFQEFYPLWVDAGKNISASLMQKSLNTSILSADSILRTTFLKNLVRLRGELDRVSKTRTEGMTHVGYQKGTGDQFLSKPV